MEDRFKFRIVVKTKVKTLAGNFDHISIYPCNGFIQTKQKIKFRSGAKDFSFYSHQVVAILQSTGLRDKNGTLIYDGDICLFENNYIYTVKFEKGCFYTDAYSDFDPLYRFKNIEVLGNIYENKELLNERE